MKKKNIMFISASVLCLVIITACTIGIININAKKDSEPDYDTVTMSGSYAAVLADEIDDIADVVVKATVTQKGDPFMPDLSIPQKYAPPDYTPRTDYTLNVTEVYKGEPEREIIVRVAGGEYDGIMYKYDRDPNLQVGKEYILFLLNGEQYVKDENDVHYEIIAISAGCFEVADDGSIIDNGLIEGDFNDLLEFLNMPQS